MSHRVTGVPHPHALPLSRRRFVSGAVVSAASLAVPALQAQSRGQRTKVSIAVGGKAAFYHLPLAIAEQLGYFRAEGLSLIHI